MDYSNLIVLTGHTAVWDVWDVRFGEDKELSNCSIPLERSLKVVSSKQYDHDELMVIAANMD